MTRKGVFGEDLDDDEDPKAKGKGKAADDDTGGDAGGDETPDAELDRAKKALIADGYEEGDWEGWSRDRIVRIGEMRAAQQREQLKLISGKPSKGKAEEGDDKKPSLFKSNQELADLRSIVQVMVNRDLEKSLAGRLPQGMKITAREVAERAQFLEKDPLYKGDIDATIDAAIALIVHERKVGRGMKPEGEVTGEGTATELAARKSNPANGLATSTGRASYRPHEMTTDEWNERLERAKTSGASKEEIERIRDMRPAYQHRITVRK